MLALNYIYLMYYFEIYNNQKEEITFMKALNGALESISHEQRAHINLIKSKIEEIEYEITND